MEVLRLTDNPQVHAGREECIENDPALTGKLLRVVEQSSLFGLSREVSDLNQALALLGNQAIEAAGIGL